MAYIELEELKDVLPGALDCCGLDAEDIEWVLQEVEQKFHIGKKPDGKKRKKLKKSEMDMILKRLAAVETQAFNQNVGKGAIDRIDGDINDLKRMVRNLSDAYTNKWQTLSREVTSARAMAETAKSRTEVDYSKYSGKSDGSVKYTDYIIKEADIIQNVYNRMAKRGATRQELDTFKGLIHKYNALDAIIDNNPEDKDCKTCKTCKYYTDREAGNGMHNSELDCYGIIGPCTNYSKWEAKEEKNNETDWEKLAKKYCTTCKYCIHEGKCSNPKRCTDFDQWEEAKDNGQE